MNKQNQGCSCKIQEQLKQTPLVLVQETSKQKQCGWHKALNAFIASRAQIESVHTFTNAVEHKSK